MIVSRRRFKSLDHAADIVKVASAAEQAEVAKAMAELARAFDREHPPHVSGLSRRGRDPG
jgi:hypothetical protein